MNQDNLVIVKDVMKPEFDIIDGMSTVQDALEQMQHIDTKSLIIDKRHENDEYGIVLISDIARRVLAKDKAPNRTNVYEIMHKPVITIDACMDIRYCARLFDQHSLSRAPVIENGKLVGIVSYTDMVLKGMANRT